MDANEQKAKEYIAKADGNKTKGFFQSFFAGSDTLDARIDLYKKGAICYKMAHKWQEAGDAFSKAAELSASNKAPHDTATYYLDASVAYRKSDPKKSIQCLTTCIGIYTEMGRFTTAARHLITMAEIYEQDLGDVVEACKQYEKAADYYKGEESTSSEMKCRQKVAHFTASAGNYATAAEIFEKVGKSSAENKLLRYGAKEHLTKAVVCKLLMDLSVGQAALQSYEDSFTLFADSRECALLKKITAALENSDVDAFTADLAEYDKISRLEPWMTDMLLRLKKTITNDEDIT